MLQNDHFGFWDLKILALELMIFWHKGFEMGLKFRAAYHYK
jgi:hypothetical protein